MNEGDNNVSNLTSEKLRLEIEEIKVNIEKSRKNNAWEGYVKPLVPVAVTLIIAIFGSIISGNF